MYILAAKLGQFEVFKYLIEKKNMDPGMLSGIAFRYACMHNYKHLFNYLINNSRAKITGYHNQALHVACKRNNYLFIKEILKKIDKIPYSCFYYSNEKISLFLIQSNKILLTDIIHILNFKIKEF